MGTNPSAPQHVASNCTSLISWVQTPKTKMKTKVKAKAKTKNKDKEEELMPSFLPAPKSCVTSPSMRRRKLIRPTEIPAFVDQHPPTAATPPSSSGQMFKEEKYLKDAVDCAEVIWQRGLLRKGYGICHGTAGNGYAFLTLYKLTQEKKYLYRACKFAEWCLDYGTHGCRIPDRPYSLFEGMAGTIHYLSEMANPEASSFPAFEL